MKHRYSDKERKPHDFQPGKDRNFPGPYCRYCHYAVGAADSSGCLKRMRRMTRPTDTDRLDWLSKRTGGTEVPEIAEVRYARRTDVKKAWTLRQAIDAAMRAGGSRK